MTYTPINWQTGDTITAEKLNKMDNGWGVGTTQVFSETVTTEAGNFGNVSQLAYSGIVSSSVAYITFAGQTYSCQLIDVNGNSYGYGGVSSDWICDFTTYPFALVFSPDDGNFIATENTGTYSLSVGSKDIDVSADFSSAVNSCITIDTSSIPMKCINGVTTSDEMATAFTTNNRMLYFHADSKCFFITQVTSNSITFIPESSYISASFVNNVFTVTVS